MTFPRQVPTRKSRKLGRPALGPRAVSQTSATFPGSHCDPQIGATGRDEPNRRGTVNDIALPRYADGERRSGGAVFYNPITFGRTAGTNSATIRPGGEYPRSSAAARSTPAQTSWPSRSSGPSCWARVRSASSGRPARAAPPRARSRAAARPSRSRMPTAAILRAGSGRCQPTRAETSARDRHTVPGPHPTRRGTARQDQSPDVGQATPGYRPAILTLCPRW